MMQDVTEPHKESQNGAKRAETGDIRRGPARLTGDPVFRLRALGVCGILYNPVNRFTWG